MAGTKFRLTERFVASSLSAGKYYDGCFGLYLRVLRSERRSWAQRLTVQGRRCTLGLGSFPAITLKQARAVALNNVRIVESGGNLAQPGRCRCVPTSCVPLRYGSPCLRGPRR